jgi:L-asparaginase
MGVIAIVATGGTIQNTPTGRVPVETVLARVSTAYPEIAPERLPQVEVVDLLRTGSEFFTAAEWLAISKEVGRQVSRQEVDGVVVTHGTFTAEETAYFLHLTVKTATPIVVVCSQRKHTTIGNDGDRNLLDALRVAGLPQARGRGVLLVMNEEIHCAREVSKSNQRPGGFVSGSSGILGSIESDQVTFYRQPERRHTSATEFDTSGLDSLPRVDIVPAYLDADGTAVRAYVDAGARGLVVMGFAFNGEPYHAQVPDLKRAIEAGVAVVLVSRGGAGRIPHKDDEFVRGDNLSPQKARVLLSLALTASTDRAELQRMFDKY